MFILVNPNQDGLFAVRLGEHQPTRFVSVNPHWQVMSSCAPMNIARLRRPLRNKARGHERMASLQLLFRNAHCEDLS